jgi:hypothetical protein
MGNSERTEALELHDIPLTLPQLGESPYGKEAIGLTPCAVGEVIFYSGIEWLVSSARVSRLHVIIDCISNTGKTVGMRKGLR